MEETVLQYRPVEDIVAEFLSLKAPSGDKMPHARDYPELEKEVREHPELGKWTKLRDLAAPEFLMRRMAAFYKLSRGRFPKTHWSTSHWDTLGINFRLPDTKLYYKYFGNISRIRETFWEYHGRGKL